MSAIEVQSTSLRAKGRDPTLPSLLGDALCLDFVNTVNDRTGPDATDTLSGYADLVRWSWHVRLIEDDRRDELFALSEEALEAARMVFARAIALREAIYRVFAAIIAGSHPADADLETITRHYLAALAEARLARDGDHFVWTWQPSDDSPNLDSILWPIARSAVELLTSDQLHRVKQCPGTDDCGWLFLDISKNGTRRWCSMDDCGSRAKMRRLYARKKARSRQ